MKKIFSSLFILFLTICYIANPQKPIELEAEAISSSGKGMCVIEASTSRVLYEKNKDLKLPMASTTKIMTALTVIENCENLDEEFEIPKEALGVKGTSLYLKAGEKLTVRELLYGLMLVSGNDASVALGVHVGGSIQEFVDKMNELANKIGAKNTHFANTHGLDEADHYTTSYDLALITATALKNDTFKEIVTTKNKTIQATKEGELRYLKNKNRLLSELDGCIGVKTGFTDDAGRCLVSACERNGMRIICVVLNCGPMFEESSTLIEEAFKDYEMVELLPNYNIIKTVPVIDGARDDVKLYSIKGFKYPLKENEKLEIKFNYNLPDNLASPVEKEKIVGEIEIYLNKDLLFSEKIYTMEEVKSITLNDKVKEIIEEWN